MKHKLAILFATVLLSVAADDARSFASAAPLASPAEASASENEWIEIGGVELYREYYVNQEGIAKRYSQRLPATLYVIYLGERMLYRVYYSGNYYSVIPASRYGYNASVVIDKKNYYLDVPQW
ncbi:MAG: hypothetical protein K2H61_07665 [Muribaculaceae bacterium]|nr:hypothetical protein [Muribaculaceae bacterium]